MYHSAIRRVADAEGDDAVSCRVSLTGAVDDEHPRARVVCHRPLGVLEQMRHVDDRVIDRRVLARSLSQARVDHRATLFVETNLPLSKPTDLHCPHCSPYVRRPVHPDVLSTTCGLHLMFNFNLLAVCAQSKVVGAKFNLFFVESNQINQKENI